ncbi:hypothetical protein PISMIDRAFT_11290 [Pisolithus microcarpus 441]|uniref:Uncharacterized protein n=1 Tax=Pisolithus microcarpus 441 TaxID=765257 RepID=A0A0C9Z1L1_9AGAM|nr:hypothetical protein PISMIDRAFT_11290 [Pisolithus microcarpus 441]
MEALQMLKYHLKQERLDFMVNWTVSPESLVEDEPEELAEAEDGDDLSTNVEIFV